MTRLAILTSAISPYHDARYRAAARLVSDMVVIAASNEGEFAEFLADRLGEYRVHRLFSDRLSYNEAVVSGRIGGETAACLDLISPDAVAVAGWTAPEALAALAWARRKGVPVILMSESQRDDAPRSLVREAVKRAVVSQFDSALVGGPPHADYVSSLGIPADRVHLGYNAVENVHFAEGANFARGNDAGLRARYGLPARYILASARFIEKKNLPTLVSAFAVAREKFADFPHLVILGDGGERMHIVDRISELELCSEVHLPGFQAYRQLPVFYGLAEAFCHCSTVEQWGLVVNEAMAAGIPVIVSSPCGVARTVLVDGRSGFIVEPSVRGIADGLAKLFAMSAEQRAAMGRAASAGVAEWGPDRFGAGMIAAIASAKARSRRGPLSLLNGMICSFMQTRVVARVA